MEEASLSSRFRRVYFRWGLSLSNCGLTMWIFHIRQMLIAQVEMLRAQVKELKGAPADQVVRVSDVLNLFALEAAPS